MFSPDQIDRPITGLESGLAEAVDRARLDQAARVGIPQATLAQILGAHIRPPRVLVEGPTSLVGQFVLGVSTGLGGNVLTAGVSAVFGWAANQLGLNYGTSGQLSDIENQLNTIEGLLISLTTQITDQAILNKTQSLLAEFHDVIQISTGSNPTVQGGANHDLITSIASFLASPSLSLNTPVSTDISSLISAINTPSYANILSDADSQLIGPVGIIMGVQQIVVNQQLGMDRPDDKLNFPWRHNRVLDRITPVFEQFAYLQAATENLYAETAHNFLLHPDPVDGITAVTPAIVANVASLKSQRQQLPLYSSLEGIITDHENAIMWYDDMSDPVTWSSASSAASSAQEQVLLIDSTVHVYDDWRLPVYGEFKSLQYRATYNPEETTTNSDVPVNDTGSYPTTDMATRGLPGLGFWNVSHALNVDSDNGEEGDLWMDYIEATGNLEIHYTDKTEFRLNHSTTDTNYKNNSGDKLPYLMCRTFGPDMLVTAYANNPAGVANPTSHNGVTYQGTQFVPAEYAEYGVPTGIRISAPDAGTLSSVPIPTDTSGNTESFDLPPGAVQFKADVDYQINLGGSFTVGSTSTKSFSNASKTSQGTVATYFEAGSAKFNGVKELLNWSVDKPNNMRMLNLPYLGGIGVPLTNQPIVVTASILGAGGTRVQNSFNYTPAPVAATIKSLQISPRNQIYGANNTQPSVGSYTYYCTGFKTDSTVVKLANSPNLVWSVSPATNPSNAHFDVGTNILKLEASTSSTPFNVTVTATYTDPNTHAVSSDNTTIQIDP